MSYIPNTPLPSRTVSDGAYTPLSCDMPTILFGTLRLWHVVSVLLISLEQVIPPRTSTSRDRAVRLLDTSHMMHPFLCSRPVCASLFSQRTTHTSFTHLRAPVALPMQIANSSILCVSSVTGIFSRQPSQAALPVRWHGDSSAPWATGGCAKAGGC